MTRHEAVSLLVAWRDATGENRARFEEMILAAMTADRMASGFVHRIELNGEVVEHRAPTLADLTATIDECERRAKAKWERANLAETERELQRRFDEAKADPVARATQKLLAEAAERDADAPTVVEGGRADG